MPQDVTPIIVALARKHNLDPQAVLAVARGEGGTSYGAVGDGGHAFGPFQLNNAGGVLTGRPGDHAKFANSPAGLEFALSGMAKAGAGGLTGRAAVERIINNYERPADKATSIRNALARLGGGGYTGAAAGPTPPVAAPAAPQQAAPAGPTPEDARRQVFQSLLAQRRGGSTDRSPVIQALAQQKTAQQAPPVQVGALASPDGKQIPVVNETGGPVPEDAKGVVAAAQKYLGTPYAWGGGGPGGPSKGFGRGAGTTGFDCSSLLQYAYAKQGKKIPRVTYEQYRTGTAVERGALQPGDAVFFHPGPNGPEHVGIYAGNGKYIQAPKTGDVVKISNLADRGDYMGARRW